MNLYAHQVGVGEPVDILRCYSNANLWDFSTYEEPAAGLANGLSTGTVRFGDTSGETAARREASDSSPSDST